ncbi:MAG: 2-oxo-4-hydroxy-4-carboxy-5-ureidoimidazoline decarboxylase [Mycobacterium sp.]
MPSLDALNAMPEGPQLHLLLGVCPSTVWARRVLEAAPFRDHDALIRRADVVLAELSDSEIDVALTGHPRIGARPDNSSSAREQAEVAAAADTVKAELARKNQEYEDNFGHVYLVCASGRSAEELLGVLAQRLDNDPETERRVMRGELAAINRLRLQRLLEEPGPDPGSTAGSNP